jgi:hypothetical protein
MNYVCQAVIGGLLFVCSATLQALPLYSISGTPVSISTLGPGATSGSRGAATSFVLTSTFSNVNITIPIDCLACTGNVFLSVNTLGAGTTLADTVFSPLQFLASQTVFHFPSLGPGQYYVGITVETGLGTWDTTTSPVPSTIPGTLVPDPTQFFTTSVNSLLAAASPFLPDLAANNALLISVTGDLPPTGIPEPSSLLMLLAGLFLMRNRLNRLKQN